MRSPGPWPPGPAAVDRRTFVRGLVLGGGAALWTACQSTAPGAPPAATPRAQPTAGTAAADWEAAWNALVAGARQEGKVVVKGPPTPEVRTDLPRAFRERFGIEMEYLGSPTGPFATQLQNERQAGIYSTDVVLSGADSMYLVFYGDHMLEPLPPVLIRPDAIDASAWPGGKLRFMDPEQQYVLRLNNTVSIMGQINTTYVKPESLTSWYDLLKPEYTGRMACFDPTVSGSGVGTAAYLYVALGEDYVRRLYVDQRPVLSRDERQLSEWLVRGTYPIAIGGEFAKPASLEEFRGSGISVVNLPRPSEAPGTVSPAFGLLGLLSHAPHPNAARVFANWIAGPEGMAVWSKAHGAVPIRLDVDKSAWPADMVPDPAVTNYFDSYGWDFVMSERQQVMAQLRQILR